METEKLPFKQKKIRGASREDLIKLDKNELVEKILQLEAHNTQLKNIISKNTSDNSLCENSERTKKKTFDFSKCHYRRVLLRIMYFGWDYQGLAVQEDSTETIEHYLFLALTTTCFIQSRETAQYHRCGRTDKGVSAFGQVISITLRSKFPVDQQYLPENIAKEMSYCKILNRLLPKNIRAVAWMPIPLDKPDYSARFDCKKRQYKYYFPRSNLNIPAMREACSHLIGSHDFRHLCKMDVGNGVTVFVREIYRADILPVHNDDDEPTTMYYLLIEGNAFLWHQIRCIMAVLLLVGEGRENSDVIKILLDPEACSRKPQYNMALDIPLNLFQCSYELAEKQHWIYDKIGLETLIAHLQSEWTLHNIKTTMIQDCLKQLEIEYSKLTQANQIQSTSEKDKLIESLHNIERDDNSIVKQNRDSNTAINESFDKCDKDRYTLSNEMQDSNITKSERDSIMRYTHRNEGDSNIKINARDDKGSTPPLNEMQDGNITKSERDSIIPSNHGNEGEINMRMNASDDKNVMDKDTQSSEMQDGNIPKSEGDSIIAYTHCLTQGVKSRVYVPLLKRVTCSSLEERIEYYRKRRKI